jgi:hypothetical protein
VVKNIAVILTIIFTFFLFTSESTILKIITLNLKNPHNAGFLNYLSCRFFKVTSSGDATKIDEYVPAITPTSSTNANSTT